MNPSSIVGLIGFGAACAVAASMGAFFRPGDWYDQLEKPYGGSTADSPQTG